MADTDYKIVGNKMYIYPNTETEQQLMTGQIAPVEGYITYITVENYYKTVEAQSEYKNRLAQYDFYLQCVRVPEWVSDAPTPPQPTYRAITVNNSYGINYVLQYTSGETVNPSAVEVGKQVVFSTNDPAYTQTFPEGLDVSVYATLPSGATAYKFRMPDYDVTITITEVQPEPQPTYRAITVNDSYSLDYVLQYTSGEELNPAAVEVGKQVVFSTNNTAYTQTFPDGLEVEVYGNLPSGATAYKFRMPDYDVTITITEVQPEPTGYNFNLVNEDSINVELYKGDWSPLDISQPISGGTQIIMLVNDYDHEATFSPSMEELPPKSWDKNNNRWEYVFNMPSNDITVSIVTIPTVTFTVENPESKQINWNTDGRDNWYNDTQTVHAGANIAFICWQNTDKITFGSPIEYTEEYDRDGRYQYHFIINEDLTVTTGNRNGAGIYYNGNTDITIQVGETPEYPTLENPNSVTPITYTSSNTDLATVDSNGNVNLTSGVAGEAHITATFEGDSSYDFTGTHFRINVRDGYNVQFIKTGAVTAENVRIYNITKQQEANFYVDTKSNDTIFVVGAAQDDKVMYKDSTNNWTTLDSSYTTETVDGNPENGKEFTMPSSINDGDYILVMASADELYDITKNFDGLLYNEQAAWWYNVEVPEHPGTYSTKYPNGTNLGIESREGQTYTINPEQTLLEGGAVGKYIVMPSVAIEITKTN